MFTSINMIILNNTKTVILLCRTQIIPKDVYSKKDYYASLENTAAAFCYSGRKPKKQCIA